MEIEYIKENHIRNIVEYCNLMESKGVLEEAEYKGKKVTLNKPMRGDVKKYKVFVKNPKTGKVIKVNFGDKNMEIRRDNPERRKSFRARHKCETRNDRTKASYWSCKFWSRKPVSDLLEGKKKLNNLVENETGDFFETINSLKTEFAIVAQNVYNKWEQYEDGYNEMYGSGGICDDIADAMCDVIKNKTSYGCFSKYDEYVCHTSIYVYNCDDEEVEMAFVDISPYFYEEGGDYTWKKIKDVEFTPNMVHIKKIHPNQAEDMIDKENCEPYDHAFY
jgi:hypothetical protein